jgi:hypothetical protein
MKTYLKRLVLIVVLMVLSGSAYADWSVSSTLSTIRTYENVIHVYVAVTSDGSAQSTALNLFPLLPEKCKTRLRGGSFVYGVYSIPDISSTWPVAHTADPPGSTYAFTITDAAGSTLTFTSQSQTASNDALKGDDTDTTMYFLADATINFTSTYSGTSGDTFFITFIVLR